MVMELLDDAEEAVDPSARLDIERYRPQSSERLVEKRDRIGAWRSEIRLDLGCKLMQLLGDRVHPCLACSEKGAADSACLWPRPLQQITGICSDSGPDHNSLTLKATADSGKNRLITYS
ncbi:MAG: hypothetical protein EHM59_22845 [Betaproteobacteria bacterium]|nr:MAG: hypothetical protein EHM59_22845 [Betaproteobacteria bacterium]